MVIVGLAIALFALPAAAAADTRFASPTGSGASGGGGCLESDPCSLDAAVEDPSVVSGDEVIVLPGTYTNLGGDHLFIQDGINLHGQTGSPRPVIQENSGVSVVFANANGLSIDHLQFENSNATGGGLALSGFTAGGITVDRVVVNTAHTNASTCSFVNVAVRDTICRNAGTGPSAQFNGNFVSSVTMRNVTIASTDGNAIDLTGGGTTTNIDWDLKNVIARGGSSSDVDVRATLSGAGSVAITLANSNYDTESESGGATVTDPGTGTNQTAVPQFVNEAGGNLHQVRTSPTVDAGVNDNLGSTDIDGDPRVVDDGCNGSNLPDIGADELNRPCNDDFAQAQVLSGSSAQVNGRTTDATEETEPNYCTEDVCGDNPTVVHSVWYSWTSPGTGPASVDVCTANYDTILAVFTGNSLGSLNEVDSNNNSVDCPPGSFASKASFDATQGTTYHFLVDGCCGLPAGTFTLTLNGPQAPEPPPDDPGTPGGGQGPDTSPPDTMITAGPEGKTKKKSATFSFSGSDARAVASFQCKLDSGSFEPCTSPKAYSGLKKGSHTFSVRAVDAAGNVDPTPATRTWKVKKKKAKK